MAETGFPQPATLFDRVRTAWSVFRDGPPMAKPLDIDPVGDASPSDPNAPVPVGTYSRAFGGFSIDARWLSQLALIDDKILNREGGGNLELYDAILDDDIAASAFQQRRLAVVSRPWEVDPGDDSAAAQAAAEHIRLQLNSLSWDNICDKMLFARWFGYAVGECMFEVGPDGKYWLGNILVPDRRIFGFTNAGDLRLKTTENPEGEAVPANKFWTLRCGASHDFAVYGTGLAHWCYWPVWFKKNILKFWAVYLEKFGMPTTVGSFADGAAQDVIDKTLEAAKAVASDRAVVKPSSVELDFMEAGRASNDSYLQFVGEMNDSLLRVIISQTGTSKSEAQGLGGSQSDVMKDVRDEVVRSDSDLLHESFNQGPVAWLTAWNFGPNVAPPRVYRNLEDQEDVNSIAERDAKLKALGWERTEDSFAEVYGEGYEYTGPSPEEREAARAAALEAAKNPKPTGANDNPKAKEKERRQAEFAAMDPKPLYVSRRVKPETAKKLLAWASAAGIPDLYPAADLHVTVLYSKSPVDWFDMGSDSEWSGDADLTIPEGGPRTVEKLGDAGAIVLRFSSNRLKWRHDEMVAKGASHDFDEYAPHVTLALAPEFETEGVEPYTGELRFGPEIFEDIVEDWVSRVSKTAFAADDLDAIDRWAAELATEADPLIAEFAALVRGKVKGVKDADQLRLALLQALEGFPTERLGELAGVPFVAARASAAVGVEA